MKSARCLQKQRGTTPKLGKATCKIVDVGRPREKKNASYDTAQLVQYAHYRPEHAVSQKVTTDEQLVPLLYLWLSRFLHDHRLVKENDTVISYLLFSIRYPS